MYVSALLTLAAVYLAVLASPGPNFFILSQLSLDGRRREAHWTAIGVATGSVVWASVSLLGLSALFLRHPTAAAAVRLLGAAYLIWYGLMLLRAARVHTRKTHAVPAVQRSAASSLAACRVGLMTGLTNPKGAVFWSSAFATLLPPGAPGWFLVTTIALVGLMSLGWHLGLTRVFGMAVLRDRYLRFERVINGVAGGALVLLGLQRAVSR